MQLRTVSIAIAVFVASSAKAQLSTAQIVGGLTVPVGYYPSPVDSTVAYVVQQDGHIRSIKGGKALPKNFLDLPAGDFVYSGERGLLGLAFHPNYATNGYAFVYFNKPNGSIQISRFTRNAAGDALDVSTRYDIINIPHPNAANHNGGTLKFGPDAYLYIGTGDGGSANDPWNNAQNKDVLLGKLLRIDIDHDQFTGSARNYAIPKGNPFRGSIPGAPEVYAYGLRNPFKWSFDSATGDLYIGDVGQSAREEIDVIHPGEAGLNFGWRAIEGTIDNSAVDDPWPPDAVFPIFDYTHDDGQCIIGGYVYHGSVLPKFYRGRYFFADYVQGKVWSIDPHAADVYGSRIEHTADLGISGNISSFDVNANGELILVMYDGRILRITRDSA